MYSQSKSNKPVDCCPHCQQKIRKLNPHRMCKQKVETLELLAKAGDWMFFEEGRGVAVAGEYQQAPYRARAHVSRLVWFGLAEHGPVRSGLYRVTKEGIDFLRGLHQVPAVIWCKDGKVVEADTRMVAVGSVRKVVLDKSYWDNYASVQKSENPVLRQQAGASITSDESEEDTSE